MNPYMNGDYDLANSFVVGDRLTDIRLLLKTGRQSHLAESIRTWVPGLNSKAEALKGSDCPVYDRLGGDLPLPEAGRHCPRPPPTKGDGYFHLPQSGRHGQSSNHTGMGFFDHMLDQFTKHSGSIWR